MSTSILYEHEDGRFAVDPDTTGDPGWHRLGPVTVHSEHAEISRLTSELEAARGAFQIAMKQTWQMIDPLRPPTAGSYALGEHNGIAAALKTVRENYERAALAQPSAPPAEQPTSTKERWNIERDGDGLLVCFNDHDKGEKCDYVRYVRESAKAAVPLTEVEMREEWRTAGGDIHGPRIETVTMPESAYFKFRRGFAATRRSPIDISAIKTWFDSDSHECFTDFLSGVRFAERAHGITTASQTEASKQEAQVPAYGYCPECGSVGEMRERSPTGKTVCGNGHEYLSTQFAATPKPEQAQGGQVPDGWKLVPVEPTIKQMAAMGPAIRACFEMDGVRGNVTDVYRAMLAATPKPQAQPKQTADEMRPDFEWWWVTRGTFPALGTREAAAAWAAWVSSGGYKAPSGWQLSDAPWGWQEVNSAPQAEPAPSAAANDDEAIELVRWYDEDGFSQGTKAPHKWVLQAVAALRRLAAHPTPDALDSARYRWLIENCTGGTLFFTDGHINGDEPASEWAAFIDAAMHGDSHE